MHKKCLYSQLRTRMDNGMQIMELWVTDSRLQLRQMGDVIIKLL